MASAPRSNIPTAPSYNFMNDDMDNDIEIQLVPIESENPFIMKTYSPKSFIEETPEMLQKELQEKLYYLQNPNTNPNHHHELPLFYDSLSNSPLSLSGNSSWKGTEGDSVITDLEENREIPKRRITYKKLTYEEIEHSIQNNYKNEKLASQLDILITFVKGQKHLYTQSYHITKQKINALVFPSLLISGSLMVISPIIQPISWSGYLLSGLNALLTIFTSILNFWNLQMTLNQYNTCATHFDRLETSLILTRNKVFLVDNFTEKNEKILDKIQEAETRMMEMKEENAVLIPPEIQLQAPIISHLDIFSFIHRLENQMKELLVAYKDTKNEIRYIMYQWKMRDFEDPPIPSDKVPDEDIDIHSAYSYNFGNPIDPSLRKEQERIRLQVLLNKKDELKHRIIEQYKKYGGMDRVFSEEIQHAETVSYFFYWGFCRRQRNVEPILREFMANYGV